jgi:HSP20 family molecular chaperone IbpA
MNSINRVLGAAVASTLFLSQGAWATPIQADSDSGKKISVQSGEKRSFDLEAQINKMRQSAPKLSLPGSLFEPWWHTMLRDPDAAWLLNNFDIITTDRDKKWTFPIGLGAYIPRVDTTETQNGVRITAEVPGVDDKHLDVTVRDNTITIKGDKEDQEGDEAKGHQTVERRYGSFERTVELPYKLDGDKAQATLKNGVLTVFVPKMAGSEAEGKKVSIKTE